MEISCKNVKKNGTTLVPQVNFVPKNVRAAGGFPDFIKSNPALRTYYCCTAVQVLLLWFYCCCELTVGLRLSRLLQPHEYVLGYDVYSRVPTMS